ncbi:MAG TPA: hypothetical protein VFD57_07345 [Clostridia bacterium]|nr:hypothetical protein [Clostridia bacterium]
MIKKENGGVVGEILLMIMGILLIALALINLILFIIGDSTIADVSTRRIGGAHDGRPSSMRYDWSIDYSFMASDGKNYSGTSTRRGSDLSVKLEKKVYYLPINPRINALASEVKPNIGQIIMISLGGFLIYVPFDKRSKRIK